MNRAALHRRHRQPGFGLVELLVALAVTGLLVTGILQVFLGTRQSYQLVSAQSYVQENGRFAVAFLQRGLRIASYPRTDGFLASRFIYTTGGLTAEGGGNANDSVTVMYLTSPITPGTLNPTTDCLANSTDYDGDTLPDYGANFYAKDRYLVLPSGHLACVPYDVNDNPQLQGLCTLPDLVANPITVSDCEEHILVEDVDGLQILYGVDSNNDSVADLFRNAAQMTAPDWGNVISLRLELLLNSGNNQGLDTADTTTTYALLDAPPVGPFGDRLIRSSFSTTVILRNRIP